MTRVMHLTEFNNLFYLLDCFSFNYTMTRCVRFFYIKYFFKKKKKEQTCGNKITKTCQNFKIK